MVQSISTVEQSQVQLQSVEDKNPKEAEAVKDGSSFQSIIAEMFDSAKEGSPQEVAGGEEGLDAGSGNRLKNRKSPDKNTEVFPDIVAGELLNPEEGLNTGANDGLSETGIKSRKNRELQIENLSVMETGEKIPVSGGLSMEGSAFLEKTEFSNGSDSKERKVKKKTPENISITSENLPGQNVLKADFTDANESIQTDSKIEKPDFQKGTLEEKIQVIDLRTGNSGEGAGADNRGSNTFQMNIGDGGSFKSLFRQIQENGISKSTFSQFLSSQIKEAVPGIVQQGTIILQNHSQGSIRLFLNPESLGTVKIDLKISENHVTGNIKVFSSEAFEAIKDNLESLKAGFIAGGFEDASLDIEYSGASDYSGEKNGQNSPGNYENYRPVIAEKDLSSPVMAAAFGIKTDGTVNLFA